MSTASASGFSKSQAAKATKKNTVSKSVVDDELIHDENEEVSSDDSEMEEKKDQDDIYEENHVSAAAATDAKNPLYTLEAILFPLLLTALSFFVRMYKIGLSDRVVWDEAHFGKFGSYYLRHEFYHDVHPPLGKMLVGLSGYLAGYNGSWDFPSGENYPEYLDYVKMRLFNAAFSALCTPVAYYTGKAIGFSLPTVWLLTILVCFENSYATLARFILLDSMLLFFTVLSFYCFVMFHNQRARSFSRKWWKWLILTGLTLGLAISVKMVGLFVISVVGIYTVVDLWSLFGDKSVTKMTYIWHWVARIVCLMMIPFSVFLYCFKIHFDLLSHSGTGDANMPSLFQASLKGTDVGIGPRDIVVGSSMITLKNQALGGALLHSHVQTYPEGSKQQQITTYGHKDSNNIWKFQRERGLSSWTQETDDDKPFEYIEDGGIYRLVHMNTQKNLHSHPIPAPETPTAWEVSGYGDDNVGDIQDNWIIEFADQVGDESKDKLHLLTTSFRLKNAQLNCYLAQTGKNLPQWGFRQTEVACIKDPFMRDKRVWWNIETHENVKMTQPESFEYPKPGFLKSFVQLNLAMMATNNALVPDSEKLDQLASSFWEWPSLHVGIRMCGWDDNTVKYFMLGSPASTWLSTIAVLAFMGLVVVYLLRWQRQCPDFVDAKKLNLFLMGGIYPLLGWGLHYTPFAIMGRVTYVHHYLPALYFALIILAYWFEWLFYNIKASKLNSMVKFIVYASYFAIVIGGFAYFSPFSFGMTGPSSDYAYLDWFPTWRVV